MGRPITRSNNTVSLVGMFFVNQLELGTISQFLKEKLISAQRLSKKNSTKTINNDLFLH